MTNDQKRAILTTAIAVLEHHPPSLESYVAFFWMRYVRQCLARQTDPAIDEFFARVPESNRRPRADAPNDCQQLLDRLRVELEQLEAEIGSDDITKQLADSDQLLAEAKRAEQLLAAPLPEQPKRAKARRKKGR